MKRETRVGCGTCFSVCIVISTECSYLWNIFSPVFAWPINVNGETVGIFLQYDGGFSVFINKLFLASFIIRLSGILIEIWSWKSFIHEVFSFG